MNLKLLADVKLHMEVLILHRIVDNSSGLRFIAYYSAWNKYFASAGHCVWQSALCAGHSQFVPVFCKWYTIEIWKPAGRKRILSVTHEIVPDSDWLPAVISCTDWITIYLSLRVKTFWYRTVSFIRPITDHMIEQKHIWSEKYLCSIILIEQNFHWTLFHDIVA